MTMPDTVVVAKSSNVLSKVENNKRLKTRLANSTPEVHINTGVLMVYVSVYLYNTRQVPKCVSF
jgi:hypothetical protein